MNKNANQFPEMYAEMGISIDKLGCIMLDLDGSGIENNIDEGDLYFTKNPDRFWIKGFIAGHTPHVTLLYGLLESGVKWKKHVDNVLRGWTCDVVVVDHVGYFESPFEDDLYYCIVAHLDTSMLEEGNQLLQLLPHIDTFPEYKAHITIAYIRKDDMLRDFIIEDYNEMLKGKQLLVKGLNYGK